MEPRPPAAPAQVKRFRRNGTPNGALTAPGLREHTVAPLPNKA